MCEVVRGLEAGAEINSLGERWTGWTALHHAADAGHCAVVRLLLERGADKDRPALDYSAHTPLHMAVAKVGQIDRTEIANLSFKVKIKK